ncbi:hypothetical protein PIROE2DRAFT_17604 [Piromyces sp. E2]|nr:hypothetical protein PIROE2DRAFT_17604 [Piromyces sp. E2]|eukprot:OUM57423.1 hypothetical protein PIROE2DRAFT_17604 [Piromyces sp. E2]
MIPLLWYPYYKFKIFNERILSFRCTLNELYLLVIFGKYYEFFLKFISFFKAYVKINGQYSEYGVQFAKNFCYGRLFADDIILCDPRRSHLNNFLRTLNKWAKNNKMNFCINKCTTLVIRVENTELYNRLNPTFYLFGLVTPKIDCYTYLGVPFHKSLCQKGTQSSSAITKVSDGYFDPDLDIN